MLTSGNPSHIRPASDAARGSLRETLSALRNLEQLLKSIRVGPRALASVIPDVHASCQSLPMTLSGLFKSIAERAADPQPTSELEAYALPRAKDLIDALAKGRRKPLTAKKRLDLEHLVATRTGEIDAVRALVECLNEALSGREVHVDLGQLAQQALASGGESSGPRAHVSLHSLPLGLELLVNPQVTSQLIVLGTSAVTDGGQRPAQISIEPKAEGCCNLRVRALTEPAADAYTVGLPILIPPTAACLNSVAQLSHAVLTRTADELLISWGPERTRPSH